MSNQHKSSPQPPPPPVPLFLLRGHSSQIHALTFLRDNARLLTADSDGYVILWNIPTRRPVAAWKAHESAVLGVAVWGHDKIITHGRDNKLFVWKLGPEEEAEMDTVTPADVQLGLGTSWRKPWLLNSLEVNTLNFCAFAASPSTANHANLTTPSIFVVFPSNMDSESVDIWKLPEQQRVYAGIKARDTQTGMAMSLRLFWLDDRNLALAAGYESGHVCLYVRDTSQEVAEWKMWFARKEHSQPVLSIEVSPNHKYILSSSADATIGKYSIPVISEDPRMKLMDTKHSGQQSIQIRDDGKIFATGGWDKMVRVYSMKTMKELAVLKWHREGVYAVGFGTTKSVNQAVQSNTVLKQPKSGNAVLVYTTEQVLCTMPTSQYLTLEERRDEREMSRHWIAAGAKDGKVSLWEVY